jgi:hypothetical protein
MVGVVSVIFSSFFDAEATFIFIRSWLLTVLALQSRRAMQELEISLSD